MANWKSIRSGIDRFIAWTKGDSILNAAALVALKGIPVIGRSLAEIYEEIDKDDLDAEGTTELLHEILAHVEQIGPTGLDDVMASLQEMRTQGLRAREALSTASTRMRDLQEEVETTRLEMLSMTDTLDRMESELSGLAWGGTDFDTDSIADQVSYLVLLKSLLDRSASIFAEQARIAYSIKGSFTSTEAPPAQLEGLDDVLWWGHRKGLIPSAGVARRQFRELRRITDRMREVNLRARALVRRGKDLLPAAVQNSKLDTHLSIWLAKYDYLREYQDQHMCLVFVGAAPTNLPFPEGVDAAVQAKLRSVMTEARLNHLIV